MSRTPRWSKAKLFDVATAAPQLLLYAIAIATTVLHVDAALQATHKPAPAELYLSALSDISSCIYLSILIVLLFIRMVPIGKFDSVWPKFAALIGFSSVSIIIFLPRQPMSTEMRIVSLCVIVLSTVSSLCIAAFLGKSFSIFPEARRLVAHGPYKIVRHPLYLAESLAAIGISLQFVQPWSSIVALTAIAAQLPRMHYEEKILLKCFPEYSDYMRRTSRFIPGVY